MTIPGEYLLVGVLILIVVYAWCGRLALEQIRAALSYHSFKTPCEVLRDAFERASNPSPFAVTKADGILRSFEEGGEVIGRETPVRCFCGKCEREYCLSVRVRRRSRRTKSRREELVAAPKPVS